MPNYACHPDTSITHVGDPIDAGPIYVWQPREREMPADLAAAVADPATTFIAHNAAFERLLLSGPAGSAIGFPQTLAAIELWSCTASRAAALGLPRKLERTCEALCLPIQKDRVGHALTLERCRPRTCSPSLTWWDDEDRMTRMANYCERDVQCEAELDRRLPELSATERAIWIVTEKMNDRGVLIDQPLLHQLIALVAAARTDLIDRSATEPAARSARSAPPLRWPRGSDPKV